MMPPCYKCANETPVPPAGGALSVHTFYAAGDDVDWIKTILMVKAAEMIGRPVICFTDHPHEGSIRKLYIWLREENQGIERVHRAKHGRRFTSRGGAHFPVSENRSIYTPQKGG